MENFSAYGRRMADSHDHDNETQKAFIELLGTLQSLAEGAAMPAALDPKVFLHIGYLFHAVSTARVDHSSLHPSSPARRLCTLC